MQTTKRIIAVLMTILMLVSAVPANAFAVVDESNPIALPKTEYAVGEAVIPEFVAQDSSSYSWIGLYAKADPTDGTVKSLWWDWTCNVDVNEDFSNSQSKKEIGSDRADFDTYVSGNQLKAGNYKLVYYSDNQYDPYVVLGIAEFSVVGESGETPEEPEVPEDTTEYETFCVGKPVYHTPTTDASIVWYGLYKSSVTPAANMSNAWAYPVAWDSCDKNISSLSTWNGINDGGTNAHVFDDSIFNYKDSDGKWHLSEGKYKFVYFGDGGYDNHLETFYFEVVAHDFSTPVVEKASFEKDGAVYNTCSCGDKEAVATITKATASLEYTTVKGDDSAKEPAVTVLDGEGTVISADDYTVVYADNIAAGEATATVTLNNENYEGTIVLSFTINEPEHICDFDEDFVIPATFDANGKKGVKCNGCPLEDEASIEIIYAPAVDLEYTSVNYDGEAKSPAVTVSSVDADLVEGVDYDLSYANNDKPGDATVTVTLKGGDYEGTKEFTYRINTMSLERTVLCPDELLIVTAYQMQSDNDWVAVTQRNAGPNDYLYYYYVDTDNSGKAFDVYNDPDTFKSKGHAGYDLPAGTYTLYFCKDNSYVVEEKLDFNVAPGHVWTEDGEFKTCDRCGATEALPTESETTTSAPVEDETTTSTPVVDETTTSTPVEDTTKAPVEESTTKAPVVDTTKAPVEEPTTKPSEEPTTKPSEEPTTAHTHTEITVAGKSATCTENGLTEGKKCSKCGEVLVAQKEISAFGHKAVVLSAVSATCTETGLTEGKKCEVCGEILEAQVTVPALGHKVEIVEGKTATCTEKGLTDGKKCADCGIVIEAQSEIPVAGHTEKVIPAKEATYTATGLTEGKQCSVCGKVTVAQKKTSRKKLKKVTGLKVKSYTSTTVKLSWNSVEGADSYKVYYSTDGKKWTKVKASKNTATIKKLKSGTQYRFKVRAFAGKYYGTASSVVKKTTKVKKVTVSSVKSAKKAQATVSWKKVTNANGYVVEYSTSKKFTKKTTKKVTIKKGKTTKTTLKKLKSGKKYYVRVKAYKTVSKKAVYGTVSSVKTVKVK